jgi:flagellar protein FliO/FliZ
MTALLGPALRMLISLAIVLALMYVAARLLRRSHGVAPIRTTPRRGASRDASQGANSRANRGASRSLLSALVKGFPTSKRGRRPARRRPRLELVARQPLGKTASLAVVRVADRTLLLGVTDSAVRLLTEIDAALFEDAEVPADLAQLPTAAALEPEPADRHAAAIPAARAGARTTVSVLDLLRERTVRRA